MVRSCFLVRLERLRASLNDAGLDGLLIADPANVRYLTGFTGTFGRLVVGPNDVYLVTDRRYVDVDGECRRPGAQKRPTKPAQAGFSTAIPPYVDGECRRPGAQKRPTKPTLAGSGPAILQYGDTADSPVYELVCAHGARVVEASLEAIKLTGAGRVGFEPGSLSWWDVRALEAGLPRRCRLIAAGGQVEELRRIKDDLEIAAIREAARATELALETVLAAAQVGADERELSALLAAELRRHGDGPPAFEPLIASGSRTAMIHARPRHRLLESGDLFLVDAGATIQGLAADMCRTVVVDQVPDQLTRRAFDAVHAALDAAIAAVHPGALARSIEAAARQALLEHGYPLLHDVGHGVGLEVHESPRLAADSDETIEAGMVLAIEPGLYVAGWGGIRLEELVLVTGHGVERLTHLKLALA